MKQLACNYAIVRFRPYRETGEFANVGIVLICPQLDYFGYIFETRKHKRITDFFPELDVNIFKAGLSGLKRELTRLTGKPKRANTQFLLNDGWNTCLGRFRELVRLRETLFYFGDVGTVLASNPKAKLDELFQHYVKRQFAKDREHQEIIMRRRLSEFLQKAHLDEFYETDCKVGDDNYHVILPFVNFSGTDVNKAIKPLHLDKDGPTEIYRHGDAWISSMRRLKQISRLPKQTLFVVKEPKGNSKNAAAAREICDELRNFDALAIPFAETDRILQFARVY